MASLVVARAPDLMRMIELGQASVLHSPFA